MGWSSFITMFSVLISPSSMVHVHDMFGFPPVSNGHLVAFFAFVYAILLIFLLGPKGPGSSRPPTISHPALRLVPYTWITALIWTIIIGTSLAWNIIREKQENFEVARNEARTVFEKDLIYYRWASEHNGVYVPINPQTPPNPYLAQVPDNKGFTSSGIPLTLVNPEYMIRQVYEMHASSYGALGHITSLDPIRPQNAADPWETKALEAFEQGATEVISIEEIDGRPYLRMMRPLITEAGCLKCHAAQGYKLGDIRGGISVAIPMTLLYSIFKRDILMFSLAHGVIWALGIMGIFAGSYRLRQSMKQQEMAEARTRAIIDNMLDGLLTLDEDGRIESLNVAASRIFGYEPSELIGENISTLVRLPQQEEDPSPLLEQLRRAIEEAGGSPVEVKGVRKHGTPFPLEISVSQMRLGETVVLIAMVRDISQEKIRKAEALRAGQLAAIGELAAGVAHEINNPINGIINYTQLLLDDAESGGDREHLDILKRIIKESERISVIVRNLLAFARQREDVEEEIQIKDVIEDGLALIRYQLQKDGIHLLVDVPSDLPPIRGNPQQLQQVFLNLLSNARYALNERYPTQNPDKRLEIRSFTVSRHGKEYVRTTVTDFGSGITSEDLAQIFDPLFTTKPPGKGTGLGLSISQGIVKDHHGYLNVESVPGEQTTVILDLPVAWRG